jgi:NAD(P)-dependent dehydrogenase (short-subunit alcohol dehydrogenase family)
MIVSRSKEKCEKAVADISAAGGTAKYVTGDMGDPQAVKDSVAATVAAFGGLDIAFNNAGITGNTQLPIFEADEADFEKVLSLNTRGVWYATKCQFAEMLKRGGGSIVVCGSVASIRGGMGRASAYYTSKHAVMGLVKQAAIDGGTRNVRVNAVLPGMIMTELVKHAFEVNPEKFNALAAVAPMKRVGRPEEVAAAVLFLCSDEASYITGVGLPVDGGNSI